jgi:hypothetical protein
MGSAIFTHRSKPDQSPTIRGLGRLGDQAEFLEVSDMRAPLVNAALREEAPHREAQDSDAVVVLEEVEFGTPSQERFPDLSDPQVGISR